MSSRDSRSSRLRSGVGWAGENGRAADCPVGSRCATAGGAWSTGGPGALCHLAAWFRLPEVSSYLPEFGFHRIPVSLVAT